MSNGMTNRERLVEFFHGVLLPEYGPSTDSACGRMADRLLAEFPSLLLKPLEAGVIQEAIDDWEAMREKGGAHWQALSVYLAHRFGTSTAREQVLVGAAKELSEAALRLLPHFEQDGLLMGGPPIALHLAQQMVEEALAPYQHAQEK